MNINFIYEGNEYQFDLFSGVTINYIKELAEKIFQYEEKGLEILYDEEIISNFDDKLKISDLVKQRDKKIIFRLEKKDIVFKNTILSSNESTNDTNNNDKYYNFIKDKFFKFNQSYVKTIEEISNFDERLNLSLEKIKKQIKEIKNYILKINETLNSFYDNNSYVKLISIFDENKRQGFTEKDLQDLNKRIESIIHNYKYLIIQNNFQINIIDYINEKKDFLKVIKFQLFKIQNINEYEDIIILLEHIFNEYFINNVPKNLNVNDSDLFDNKNFHSFNEAFHTFNENKKNFRFPKIKSFNSEQINRLLLDTEKIKNGKRIKLVKKNKSDINSHYKNLSLSSSYRNKKNSNNTVNLFLNKLPLLDNKSIDAKTIDSTQVPTINSKKSSKNEINTLNIFDDNTSKFKINTKTKDLGNLSLNNEVKPKIMGKNNKNIKSRNYHNIDNINSKTMIFDNYFTYNEKKNNIKIPSLYDSIIKNKENDIQNLSERNNKKSFKYFSNTDIPVFTNKEKNNENDAIIDLKQMKNTEREKDVKSKFKPKNIENVIEKKSNNIIDNMINKNINDSMLIKSKTNETDLLKKPLLSIQDSDMILLRRKTDDKIFKLSHFASMKNNLKKIDINNERNETKKETFKKINFKIDNENNKEKNIEKDIKRNKKDDKENKKEKEKNNDKKKGKKNFKEEDQLINTLKEELNKTKQEKFSKIKVQSKNSTKQELIIKEKQAKNLINKNRKENNKEQIQKLTKDLLSSKTKEKTKMKTLKKETKDIIKKNNDEEEEKKEEEKTIIDSTFNENINEENKKKKKKQINLYDFII